MIMFLVILLVVLWLLGMVTTTTLGGWLHILLVIAFIFLLIRRIRGQRVERPRRHDPCSTQSSGDAVMEMVAIVAVFILSSSVALAAAGGVVGLVFYGMRHAAGRRRV